MAGNNFTGFQKTASGLYYLVRTPGIGTDIITDNSTVSTTYTGFLLNANIFDQYNTADGSGVSKDIDAFLPGIQEGLKSFATTGAYVSFFLPSRLAYGNTGATGVPVNSVVRFDMRVTAVTP